MSIKAGALQKVVALPVTKVAVDREGGIQSALRISELGTLGICRLRISAVQNIATGVDEAIIWNLEDFDTAVLHDLAVNPSRMTAPIKGKYRIDATIAWAVQALGRRSLRYSINGGTAIDLAQQDAVATATFGDVMNGSTVLDLNKGDYVEIEVGMSGVATLDVIVAGTHALMQYLGE